MIGRRWKDNNTNTNFGASRPPKAHAFVAMKVFGSCSGTKGSGSGSEVSTISRWKYVLVIF